MLRLKKDGLPDKRQFRYKWYGYEEKPPVPSQRPSRKAWVKTNKKHLQKINKDWRNDNKEKLTADKRDYWNNIRNEVIDAYGGNCQCCGESDKRFLTLEHVYGRKNHGRSATGKRITGKKAMAEVKRLGFPKDKFQILCFNCNCAKGIYGKCPHQIEREVRA
jgi:hypothetical protein